MAGSTSFEGALSLGSPASGFARETRQAASPPVLLGRQLQAIASADKVLTERLHEEVFSLESKVSQAKKEMATATLQAESARESQARLSELQRQLERQIREHREHLSKVAQERRRLLDITCHGSTGEATAQRQWLEEALNDERRCLQETREANGFLDSSLHALRAEMADLQQERAQIMAEAQQLLPHEAPFPSVDGSTKSGWPLGVMGAGSTYEFLVSFKTQDPSGHDGKLLKRRAHATWE
ncbi:unnamed protein product [Durusdinium trenchii]|uniref:Uncharacterized protein n=1 Tax=Durusdinium trenchii TaxID=1381693 RepID=A0ABP0I8P2_9DINO